MKGGAPTKKLVQITAVLMLGGLLLTAATTVRTYRSLHVPDQDYLQNIPRRGVVMYDRTGSQFFSLHTPGRHFFSVLDDLPATTSQALIAAEDRTFFKHQGVSVIGVLRAAYLDIKYRELAYGGSTITQQLVKTVLLNPKKSFSRKYRETLYALRFEQKFTKDQILEMYLNTAYFGESAYGIEAAAQTYFRKSAPELTVSESALLIGLLPAPTALSPISGNRAAAKQRQLYVLQQMVEEGFISLAEGKRAAVEELTVASRPPHVNTTAHHFGLHVYEQLLEKYPREYVNRAGLQVYTTLDPEWQSYAQRAVADHLDANGSRFNAENAATVVIDTENRSVRALVGSVNWYDQAFGKVNMATAPRQTGSAFKPIVYAAALEERRATPATILQDRPITFGTDYRPENYDQSYRGRVNFRYALANSLNIPAVDLISDIGPRLVVQYAKRLGISSLQPYAEQNLSLALGTEEVSLLELTNAYATFAHDGWYRPPRFIERIEDKYGEEVEWREEKESRAVSSETAFLVSSILSDNDIRRTTFGNTLVTNPLTASKTGTTQSFKDAWTVGYTPSLAVGVWMGNNDTTPMTKAPGATAAAPVWRQLIEHYARSTDPTESFTAPPSLISRYICPSHGLLAGAGNGRQEYFIAGTEPTRYCPKPKPESNEETETGAVENKPAPPEQIVPAAEAHVAP